MSISFKITSVFNQGFRKTTRKGLDGVWYKGHTEEAKELDPADLLIWAVAVLIWLIAEVSEVVQFKQVYNRDVDQLLGAESFLKNQPLWSESVRRIFEYTNSDKKMIWNAIAGGFDCTWNCSSSFSLRVFSLSRLLQR